MITEKLSVVTVILPIPSTYAETG